MFNTSWTHLQRSISQSGVWLSLLVLRTLLVGLEPACAWCYISDFPCPLKQQQERVETKDSRMQGPPRSLSPGKPCGSSELYLRSPGRAVPKTNSIFLGQDINLRPPWNSTDRTVLCGLNDWYSACLWVTDSLIICCVNHWWWRVNHT